MTTIRALLLTCQRCELSQVAAAAKSARRYADPACQGLVLRDLYDTQVRVERARRLTHVLRCLDGQGGLTLQGRLA